jgi:hypothetical protein
LFADAFDAYLVKPEMIYLNERYFRDYGREQILTLKAVATLRRANFSVEQISVMQLFPEQIRETVSFYLDNLKDELDKLTTLRTVFERDDMKNAASIYDLASNLERATKGMKLPTVDLKFNFKRFDKVTSEIRNDINSKPPLSFRFGWFNIYSGHNYKRFQDIQSKLNAAGIKFRGAEYTVASRLSLQGVLNQGSSFQNSKGPTVMPAGFQAKALSDKSLDMYYIDVRKKDSEKAREALRSVI